MCWTLPSPLERVPQSQGGITSASLLRAVRRIISSVNLVAMDLVEVSPAYDSSAGITAEAAHRIVLEAISALAWVRTQRRV